MKISLRELQLMNASFPIVCIGMSNVITPMFLSELYAFVVIFAPPHSMLDNGITMSPSELVYQISFGICKLSPSRILITKHVSQEDTLIVPLLSSLPSYGEILNEYEVVEIALVDMGFIQSFTFSGTVTSTG